MKMTWPKICARCGTTENLHGENVPVQQSKLDWIRPKQHRDDETKSAHIYLCTECEVVAKKEYWELKSSREVSSFYLLCFALLTSIMSMPLMIIILAITLNIPIALVIAFIVPGVFWTLAMSNFRAKKLLNLSGYRRFYFDWTLDGSLRFTNENLKDSFERENENKSILSIKLVDQITGGKIETPSSLDWYLGMFLGLIIVSIFLFLFIIMRNSPFPYTM